MTLSKSGHSMYAFGIDYGHKLYVSVSTLRDMIFHRSAKTTCFTITSDDLDTSGDMKNIQIPFIISAMLGTSCQITAAGKL